MSFRQRVAAIKREHRKRHPRSLWDTWNEISRATVAAHVPKMVEQLMRPSLLGVMIEKDRAGGVWRRGLAPFTTEELMERSRQYSVLRELEGA